MSLEQHIEGVLFYKAEPMKKSAIAALFKVDPETLEEAFTVLGERLKNGATRLVVADDTVELVTSPEMSDVIEQLRKDELKRDIGKAGAETLAIIVYRGPLTRADIDRIRGVNSNFILRNLLIRGLIERRENPKDQRTYLYAATGELFNHLGVAKREELTDFTSIMDELDTFEKDQLKSEDENKSLV